MSVFKDFSGLENLEKKFKDPQEPGVSPFLSPLSLPLPLCGRPYA